MSSADSTSSQPPSIHWNGQNRAPEFYHAMKAGASGFLLKDTREQLTGAIRAVHAGETLLAPASEATIESHITRILARLGLRDRVRIAVYAYEYGIVRPGQPGLRGRSDKRAPDNE